MNYLNKYIKYKNKYLIIKNQIGNGLDLYRAPTCTISKIDNKKEIEKKLVKCNINFNNALGTCWSLSIFMIFYFSDSTSKCVQPKIFNMSSINILKENELLKYFLPINIFSQTETLIELLDEMKERFNIKVDDQKYGIFEYKDSIVEEDDNEDDEDEDDEDYNNYNIDVSPTKEYNAQDFRLRRQHSRKHDSEFTKILFKLMNHRNIVNYGGNSHDSFFLINILSCLFLQKLIKLNHFFINDYIELSLLKNTIGILIYMPKHICSFYICENEMKFCDNDMIISYNWLGLFKKCNILSSQGTNFNVYLQKKQNIYGPFIHYDNKIIYFNNSEITEVTTTLVNFGKKYDKINSFIFLIYQNKKNFKRISNHYYSGYYIENNFISEYKDFLDSNNISGFDLNNICYNNTTPLFNSCYERNIEISDLLLKYDGININLPDKDGYTPLHLICHKQYVELVQLFIQHPDILINQANKDGNTPLIITCHKSDVEIVNILLSHPDILINQANKDGHTPLIIACHKGNVELVNILLLHTDILINQADKNETTPLIIACQKGHVDIVNVLLLHPDILINQVNKNGTTPLIIACQKGHVDIVNVLLSHPNILINQANKDGNTPLHIACLYKHASIVKLLIDHQGLLVNQKNKNGHMALSIACNEKYLEEEIVKLLLSHPNIKINRYNKEQYKHMKFANSSIKTHLSNK